MNLAAPRRACLAMLAAVAAGCATPPPSREGPPWISGQLALRIGGSADTPARSLTGLFDLRGDARAGEFRLSSPLGTLIATLQWSPGSARLLNGEGEATFADLGELSHRVLGESLPLQALPEWLAGRPWSGAPSLPTADGFEQLGWQVRLSRLVEGQLEAGRTQPPEVRVRVRLDR